MLITPILLRAFNEILLGRAPIPPSLQEATITVLAKPGKDPTLCTSYRPISLLNQDYKILMKLVAGSLHH